MCIYCGCPHGRLLRTHSLQSVCLLDDLNARGLGDLRPQQLHQLRAVARVEPLAARVVVLVPARPAALSSTMSSHHAT